MIRGERIRRIVLVALFGCALAWSPVHAVDRVPETSGFSGFVLIGGGVAEVSSNLIHSGAPLTDDVANTVIESIFDAPKAQTAPVMPFMAEVNYTFAKSRTQLFFGNRLEDVLRLDVAFGLGVRQELKDKSVIALSALATPAPLKVWSDPYVEGQNRVKTDFNTPGARFRWGSMFGTGLELTAEYRRYDHDLEASGDFLIDEGRLDPLDQPLLDRDGDVWRLQFRYRLNKGKKHIFEPTIRYTKWELDGAAMAHEGPSLQLTYLYVTPKLVLDTNLIWGTHDADAIHPVYGQRLDVDRYGVALTAFYDLFGAKRWRAVFSADFFRENANIPFFESDISMLFIGAIWRHTRK